MSPPNVNATAPRVGQSRFTLTREPSRPIPTPTPLPEPTTPEPVAAAVENPRPNDSTWRRFNLLAGGSLNLLPTQLYADAPAYQAVASEHNGGGFFVQPSYSLIQSDLANFRVGFNYGHQFFTTAASSPNRSSFERIALGVFLEAAYTPHRNFGVGLQGRVDYNSIIANSVDVGIGAASANFRFWEDGNLGVGASIFLSTWNQAFRVYLSADFSPGTAAEINLPPPDSPISVRQTPNLGLGAALDIFGVIRNLQD